MTNDEQPELPGMDRVQPAARDDRAPAGHLATGPCDCLHCLTRAIIRRRRDTTNKPGADDREVA